MSPTGDGLCARVGGAVAVLEGLKDIRMHMREALPTNYAEVVAIHAVGTVVGKRGGAGQYSAAVTLVESGAVRIEGTVTHRFPLTDTAEAFQAATAIDIPVGRDVLVTEGP